MSVSKETSRAKETGYAPVNGLQMYYEISGAGEPLIYIPAAFAFSGLSEFPELAKRWKVVQVDLQGHGRTADIDRPLSFEQHVNDVIALMRHLKIERASFLGWSYGGLIALLIANKHPELVNRIVTYGSLYGAPQDAIRPDKFGPPREDSPDAEAHQFARESYKRVAPDPDHWHVYWQKMMDIVPTPLTPDQLAAFKHRVLVVVGDNDFIRVEHALQAQQSIPGAELAVIPDATHFLLFEEPARLEPIVARFLSAPDRHLPFGLISTGYLPGVRR